MTIQAVPRDRKIVEVSAVKPGLLVLTWEGGAMGWVDMRQSIATQSVFEFLKDHDAFAGVRVADGGTSIYWNDHEGDIVDMDTKSLWLRRRPIGPAPTERKMRAMPNRHAAQ